MQTSALGLALIEAAQALNASGINAGTSGNLSARIEGGLLITPSAKPYERMQVDDLVEVTLEGEWASGRKPSSEWRIHRDIYRTFAQAQAVVHAHPAHCAALASHRRGIPAFHYGVALAGGRDIRCADYATFGSQALSNSVLRALDGRRACLMANHGLVCFADGPATALRLAVEIEHLARAYCQALALGEPEILDDAEMARVLERFGEYRAGASE